MPSQAKAIQLTAALLIAFALAFFFYYGLNTINDPVFAIDFLPYHMAGRLLAAGDIEPLTDYARTGSFGATSGPFLDYFHRYFFPDSPSATHWIYLPGYAWIFRPLAGLEFPAAARAWLVISAVLSLACIGLLWSARPWTGDKTLTAWRTAWIVFFGLTFQPVLDNMWHGNISALIFFAFCLSYWLLRRGHPWLAGLILGLIVPLKFYPAFFVLYFVWRRNWALVVGAVVGCLVVLGVSLLTVGWAGNIDYFRMVLAELRSGGIPAFNNQSISGFLLHAFTSGDVNAWGEIAAPRLVSILRLVLVGALIGVVAWALCRRPEKTADPVISQDLDLALVIGVMLLASPITWYHYYVWLLFPLVVLFDHLLVSSTTNTRNILLFAIGYGLVVVQGIVVIRPFAAQAIQDVWLLRVLLSQAFFGAVVLMFLLWRMRIAVARIE
jgi:alpha-1,2-mannosyltransferase